MSYSRKYSFIFDYALLQGFQGIHGLKGQKGQKGDSFVAAIQGEHGCLNALKQDLMSLLLLFTKRAQFGQFIDLFHIDHPTSVGISMLVPSQKL